MARHLDCCFFFTKHLNKTFAHAFGVSGNVTHINFDSTQRVYMWEKRID